MGEIDFKKNKERTRKMLIERAERARKEEKREKIIFYILLFLVIIAFLYFYSVETNKAINSCVKSGNSEDYCIYATR